MTLANMDNFNFLFTVTFTDELQME